MKRCLIPLLLAFTAHAQVTLPLFKPGRIRVLVLSGRNNHDWRATTPELRRILEATGNFDVRVNEEPSGMTAATLAAYQVLVLDYNGPRWGAGAEQAVASFVRGGKGMIVVHGASWAFHGLDVLGDRHVRMGIFEPPWPDYAAMIGSAWSLDEPATGHGKRHVFPIRIVNRDHPIACGLAETLEADDELYHNMRMRPEAAVLATAFDDVSQGGTGKDEPILWTVAYGKGRVFHTTLGHDVAAMRKPAFVLPLERAAAWVAGLLQ